MRITSDFLINSLENQYKPPKEIKGDVIILLGGGATLDTPNLSGKGHLGGSSANRLLTCLQLYHKLNASIIISGGKSLKNQGNEAEVTKNIMIGLGIPLDKIIIENKSVNTEENIKFVKILVKKYNYHNPVLVTSAFHMPRSYKLFKKEGVSVLPYPADYHANIVYNFELHDFIPSTECISNIKISLKEYLGILAINLGIF